MSGPLETGNPRKSEILGQVGLRSNGILETELRGCFSISESRMNRARFAHENLIMGRRLTSGVRPVGRSTAFRLCGWGRREQEGK